MDFKHVESALLQLNILMQLNKSINEDFQYLYNQNVLENIQIIKDKSMGGFYLNQEIQQLINKLQKCIDNTNTMTDYNIHCLTNIINVLKTYISI